MVIDMNNKNKKTTFCDIEAILEKLDGLEIDDGENECKELQEVRSKLATLWLNHARKMQRFKNVGSKMYRYHAIEEDFILSAIGEFWSIRRYVQENTLNGIEERLGGTSIPPKLG
jgi:hypothetical protein